MVFTPFAPPPGLINDDTVFAAPGRWSNGSLARFFEAGWQVKGGWERLTLDNLGGVCRAALAWTDTASVLVVAFGLHNGLKVWSSGFVSEITPQYTVGPGPGPVNISTFLPDVIGVNEPGHTRQVGDVVTVAGATVTLGGVNVNGTFTVVTAFPGFWTYTVPGVTSSVNSGADPVTVTANIPPGQIDGTGGAGYGTGAYGVGSYGLPSTAEYFPRTWSLSNFGGNLIANPRGGTIYQWEQDPLTRAVALTGAPSQVTFTVVTPQRQVMAIGCNEEVSGVFNPLCIRWSDIEDNTDWISSPNNNAGEWILELGGRLVCARIIGDYVFAWTTDSLFMGTFVGAPGQTWKFEKTGDHCGAISPGAPIIKSQVATWISPDRVFWACPLGGAPKVIECPIRQMFVDHITAGQDDKIVGDSTSTYSELTWFWPDDRDGFECSRAINFSPDGWSRDILPRTAYIDAGPQVFPVGVKPTGQVYWHEKGHTDDGAPLTGFLESSDFYLSEAEGGMLVNGIYPDFRSQQGAFALTINTREFPQSPQRPHGPWSLAPGQAKRCFRLSGRIARVRWDWSSAPAYARGGKPELDVQKIGGRG